MTSHEAVHLAHQMSALEGRRREVVQQAARPARVQFTADVRGVGETYLKGRKAINFGAFMLEEPSFTFGCVLTTPVAAGELPQCTAMVTGWVKTDSGVYTGAEMAFYVESPKSNIGVRFCLSFEASTMRSTAGATNHG